MGERTIDLIDEGFDLAVQLAPPPDSSLVVRGVAIWRHVLCWSPAYLEKYGPPQQLSGPAERNCVRHVSYPYGDDWHFVERNGMLASVRVAGNLVTNAPRGLLAPQRNGAMCHFRPRDLMELIAQFPLCAAGAPRLTSSTRDDDTVGTCSP
jgi:DNA-binding transcriptional LysR family regulator